MTNITKTMLGTVAAGAMALSSAAPAAASDRYHKRDRIDAGDVIAGAVIIGGLAAILSSGKKDRYRYDDRRYRDRDYRGDRYDRRSGRRAVEKCVRAAERDARRYGYRYADVTQIRDVERTRYGWKVKGRIVVEDGRYGYRDRYGYDRRVRYDRDYRYDRRGDRGKFSCYVERGRVVDVNYRNIRGLR